MCHWLTNEHFQRLPPSTTGKSCRGSSVTLKTHPLRLSVHFLFIPMFKPPVLLVHLFPVKMLHSVCVRGHYFKGIRRCICVGVFNSTIQLCHGTTLQQAQEDLLLCCICMFYVQFHRSVFYYGNFSDGKWWSAEIRSLSRIRNVNSEESCLQSRKEELGISSFRLSNLCVCPHVCGCKSLRWRRRDEFHWSKLSPLVSCLTATGFVILGNK